MPKYKNHVPFNMHYSLQFSLLLRSMYKSEQETDAKETEPKKKERSTATFKRETD